MKRRIINHWTAGTYTPNPEELHHYHYLIDGETRIIKGVYPVTANDNCRDREYARHTGGGNTRSIGVAVCGMLGFNMQSKKTAYPITVAQLEKLCRFNAELLHKEGWDKATPENLMTHYEFGKLHPETPSAGKIDIMYLPSHAHIPPDEVGKEIRNKTNWYLEKLKAKEK